MTSTPTSRRGCAGRRTIGSWTDLSRLMALCKNGSRRHGCFGRQPDSKTMKKTLLIATALTASAYTFSSGATQEAASLLESLPAEVQKDIEETRASCRSVDVDTLAVTSGDSGLIQLTASSRYKFASTRITSLGSGESQRMFAVSLTSADTWRTSTTLRSISFIAISSIRTSSAPVRSTKSSMCELPHASGPTSMAVSAPPMRGLGHGNAPGSVFSGALRRAQLQAGSQTLLYLPAFADQRHYPARAGAGRRAV